MTRNESLKASASPRRILSLIWEGAEGWVELAGHGPNGQFWRVPLLVRDALERLSENPAPEYFSLLPRVRPRGTKADVAPYGRNVWFEVDHLDGLDERLARIAVPPTVLYSSGRRGWWCIWVLEELISTDDIEVLLRSLATLADGDRRSAERSRLGRIPGSVNHRTNACGEIIHFDPAPVRWTAFDHIDRTPVHSRTRLVATTRLHFAARVERHPSLPPNLQRYVEARQVIPHGQGGRYDRSAKEQAIFAFLLRNSFTTAEVATLARDVYRLPRFLEDYAKGNERRIADSLEEASRYVRADEERRRGADVLRPHRRRRTFLRLFGSKPQRTRDIICRAVAELGIQERQAYKYLRTVREHKLITVDNVLTEYGQKKLTSKSPFCFFH